MLWNNIKDAIDPLKINSYYLKNIPTNKSIKSSDNPFKMSNWLPHKIKSIMNFATNKSIINSHNSKRCSYNRINCLTPNNPYKSLYNPVKSPTNDSIKSSDDSMKSIRLVRGYMVFMLKSSQI